MTNYVTDEINKENLNEFCIFIADQKPENTKQETKYDEQTWYNFCGKTSWGKKIYVFRKPSALFIFKHGKKEKYPDAQTSNFYSFSTKDSPANLPSFRLSREVLKPRRKQSLVKYG